MTIDINKHDPCKEFVLIYAEPETKPVDKVLLILKDRPIHQKGRYNLLGGHVEPGEKPVECALRELHEESGLLPAFHHPQLEGKIIIDNVVIYCYRILVDDNKRIEPREGETEICGWHNWFDIKDDPRLLPNLKIMIPLLMNNINGWTLNYNSFRSEKPYGFGILLET